MLEGGEPLPLATDERAKGLVLFVVGADHIEAIRLAGLDVDGDREAQVLHQLLEESLPCVKCGRRRLGGLELLALSHERASGLDLVGLAGGDDRHAGSIVRAARGAVVPTGAAVPGPLRAVVATRGVGTRCIATRGVAARCIAVRGWVVAARRIRARRIRALHRRAVGSIVAARRIAVRGWVVAARAAIHGAGERPRGGRLTLRRGAPERGARRGDDPGGLGAHPQNAPAARGQDLEVELVEADAKFLAGVAQGFLDGLASELTVRTHAQRFLPRRP